MSMESMDKLRAGEPVTFREFALESVQALGVFSLQEDEENGAPYYAERLALANQQLDEAQNMSIERAEELALSDYNTRLAQLIERQRASVDAHAIAGRYKAMLAEVEEWTPVDDPLDFKDFMINQLRTSISTETSRQHDSPPLVRLTGEDYREALIQGAWADIAYYTDRQVEQTLRSFDSREWADGLIDSLPDDSQPVVEPVSPLWQNAG